MGKTHNYWHGAVLLLEERAIVEGELSPDYTEKTPPPYDGNYSDDILDPLKHVREFKTACFKVNFRYSSHFKKTIESDWNKG